VPASCGLVHASLDQSAGLLLVVLDWTARDDAQAESLQRAHLALARCQQDHVAHAQIAQDLRADAKIPLADIPGIMLRSAQNARGEGPVPL